MPATPRSEETSVDWIFLMPCRGNQPCQQLDCRFLASGTARECISAVATSSVVICYSSPRNEHTWLNKLGIISIFGWLLIFVLMPPFSKLLERLHTFATCPKSGHRGLCPFPSFQLQVRSSLYVLDSDSLSTPTLNSLSTFLQQRNLPKSRI